jgi:metal-responsive CopG/Arc/MetJ family transcriptional regulator
MSGKIRTAQFPSELDEQYEKYREQKDLNKSEAVRSLIRKGLEYERQDTENGGTGLVVQWLITVGSVSAVSSVLALATATKFIAGILVLVAVVTNLAALWKRYHA